MLQRNSSPESGTVLLDVSRLIWRTWTARLPTGIDRVCAAYLEYFGPRSLAVLQRNGHVIVLSASDSRRLVQLLQQPVRHFRLKLVLILLVGVVRARLGPPRPGMVYYNPGHTGLEHNGLARWIVNHHACAVVLVHDLIPITHPQFCREEEQVKHGNRIRNAILCASAIVVNSGATLEELRDFAAEQGLTLPPTVVAWISGAHQARGVHARESIVPYFVTVGTIEGRKNHMLLLSVWRRLINRFGARTPHLLVIGQRGWCADDVFALLDHDQQLHPYVNELSRCDDNATARIVAGATAMLMPTHAEGFGLPVAEALQLGTPVIASDLPVLREVGCSCVTYLGPTDEAGWEEAITRFLEVGESARQREQLRQYRSPTWHEHFSTVENFLRALSMGEQVGPFSGREHSAPFPAAPTAGTRQS